MRPLSLPIVGLVLVGLLASACSTPVQRRDWSEFDGPGAEYFQREEIDVFDLTDAGAFAFDEGRVGPRGIQSGTRAARREDLPVSDTRKPSHPKSIDRGPCTPKAAPESSPTAGPPV